MVLVKKSILSIFQQFKGGVFCRLGSVSWIMVVVWCLAEWALFNLCSLQTFFIKPAILKFCKVSTEPFQARYGHSSNKQGQGEQFLLRCIWLQGLTSFVFPECQRLRGNSQQFYLNVSLHKECFLDLLLLECYFGHLSIGKCIKCITG